MYIIVYVGPCKVIFIIISKVAESQIHFNREEAGNVIFIFICENPWGVVFIISC